MSDKNAINSKLVVPAGLILLIGPPASGKSTFAKDFLNEYGIGQDPMMPLLKKCSA
jgi:type II secretory ATPase GspE/PulE/Tfp pilus assembly ATPase PilB-like protein